MSLKKSSKWLFPDTLLLASILLLAMVGVVMVTSATVSAIKDSHYFLYREVAFYLAAFLAGFLAFLIPNGALKKYVFLIYFVALIGLLLIFIPNVGVKINGARRWINFRILNYQPAEFAKLAMVIMSAYLLSRYHSFIFAGTLENLVIAFKVLIPAGIFALLLLPQPDFGSTFVIFATIMGMLFLAGLPLRWFAVLAIILAVIVVFLILPFEYRRNRITSFLHPFDDELGKGYQLATSLIAIGRGGWTGVGLGDSVLKHEFLPEKHTDFIFSIIAEEFGFIGCLIIIGIFSLFVWRIFVIAQNAAKNRRMFACYLGYGFGLWFGLQALINIGVVSGCLPTKGLTLPLISYGGSSLLITGIALGIILRIDGENRYLEQKERE